jgi:hypothetical protein
MFHHIMRRGLILAGSLAIAAGTVAPAAIAQAPLPGHSENDISCDYNRASVHEQLELYKANMAAGNYAAANRALGVALYDVNLARQNKCAWVDSGQPA